MNNIVFNNLDGELVGGVSIKNIVENNREKYMGGSTNTIGNNPGNNVGLSKFDDFVVPVGLYMSPYIGGKQNDRKKETDAQCISDELYEKLFGIVRYDIPKIEKNRKTKKKIKKEGQNKTKKQ